MLITFEGPEGCGKTTQSKLLAGFLQTRGFNVLLTREPGGTPVGEQVRAILADMKNAAMLPHTEFLLFQASRAQLVGQVIRPHLAAGGVVVSDRYADSTLAYQGFGHGLPLQEFAPIIAFATGGLQPNLTFLLDLDVEVGLQRKAHGAEWNRLDALDVAFHQRVRRGYLQLAHAEPQRWVIVDAAQPVETIQQVLRAVLLPRLAG